MTTNYNILVNEHVKRGLYISQLMMALHHEAPDKYPDDCQVCGGQFGGVRGNENIVNGITMCDMCGLTEKGGEG